MKTPNSLKDNFEDKVVTEIYRLSKAELTLKRIEPHLKLFGISRCADITGLDCLGIPVYCAIRPNGYILQTANGKGLNHIDAKVSALMEAIEFYHIDTLPKKLKRSSVRTICNNKQSFIQPTALAGFKTSNYFSEDLIIEWVKALNLFINEEIWLPASAVYNCSNPMLYNSSTNGLASGNHIVEATLHGLYEIIERDAVSKLGNYFSYTQLSSQCKIVDLETVDSLSVKGLCQLLAEANIKLVLVWLKSCIPVNTFWAIILDSDPMSIFSMVNVGFGTHLSSSVAAIRAITEAAQTRLAFIHGAREDLEILNFDESKDAIYKLYEFFKDIKGSTNWASFPEMASNNIFEDYTLLLHYLAKKNYKDVFRVDLTLPEFDIPVVKIFAPTLQTCTKFL